MLKSSVALFVLLIAGTAATADDTMPFRPESVSPTATWGTYVAEAGGALLGTAVLGGGFAFATLFYPAMVDDEGPIHWSRPALTAASATLGFLGCAGGTTLIGHTCGQNGQFLPTLGWAAGATAAGAGLIMASTQLGNRGIVSYGMHIGIDCVGAALLVATPFVTVYGYNCSRSHDPVGARFLPGSIGLRPERTSDGKLCTSLDVRLLAVRF